MKRSEIRLELLKLRHRHDLHPEQIMTDVKLFETYVLEALEGDSQSPAIIEKRRPGRPKKSATPENPL
jgi:hypothetical protein